MNGNQPQGRYYKWGNTCFYVEEDTLYFLVQGKGFMESAWSEQIRNAMQEENRISEARALEIEKEIS